MEEEELYELDLKIPPVTRLRSSFRLSIFTRIKVSPKLEIKDKRITVAYTLLYKIYSEIYDCTVCCTRTPCGVTYDEKCPIDSMRTCANRLM